MFEEEQTGALRYQDNHLTFKISRPMFQLFIIALSPCHDSHLSSHRDHRAGKQVGRGQEKQQGNKESCYTTWNLKSFMTFYHLQGLLLLLLLFFFSLLRSLLWTLQGRRCSAPQLDPNISKQRAKGI